MENSLLEGVAFSPDIQQVLLEYLSLDDIPSFCQIRKRFSTTFVKQCRCLHFTNVKQWEFISKSSNTFCNVKKMVFHCILEDSQRIEHKLFPNVQQILLFKSPMYFWVDPKLPLKNLRINLCVLKTHYFSFPVSLLNHFVIAGLGSDKTIEYSAIFAHLGQANSLISLELHDVKCRFVKLDELLSFLPSTLKNLKIIYQNQCARSLAHHCHELVLNIRGVQSFEFESHCCLTRLVLQHVHKLVSFKVKALALVSLELPSLQNIPNLELYIPFGTIQTMDNHYISWSIKNLNLGLLVEDSNFVEYLMTAGLIYRETETKYRCNKVDESCRKAFIGPGFVAKHLINKHKDLFIRQPSVITYFMSFLQKRLANTVPYRE